jgi:hypothetical protein
MPVLNPDHLLDQASRLISSLGRGAPRQADLRRAISSTYYALFHAIVTQAADDFFGKPQRASPLYQKVFRSVEHRKLRRLCDDIVKSNLPRNHSIFGHDLIAVASAVIDLQEKRHSADYDPHYRVNISDANSAVKAARAALASFRSLNRERQTVFSSLLILPLPK